VIAFSWTGNHGVFWIVLGCVTAVAQRDVRTALVVAALTWGALCLNATVKRVVRRDRPPHDGDVVPLIPHPTSHSFPSSHAAMSAAAACGLTAAVPGLGWLFATLALLMAASRLYLAVHYPLDVAVGLALGLAVGGAYLLVAA
jgi:membrane-associated phospholipid phosphatase